MVGRMTFDLKQFFPQILKSWTFKLTKNCIKVIPLKKIFIIPLWCHHVSWPRHDEIDITATDPEAILEWWTFLDVHGSYPANCLASA